MIHDLRVPVPLQRLQKDFTQISQIPIATFESSNTVRAAPSKLSCITHEKREIIYEVNSIIMSELQLLSNFDQR